jgi:cob(I)alamin adenosyltransferase
VKIYTKSGDDGLTGLLGAGRVSKAAPRIDAYGTVDELNAALGVARAAGLDRALEEVTSSVQSDLFSVGAALADPDPNGPFHQGIQPSHAQRLEHLIDHFDADLPPLSHFILPGGSKGAAELHLARTICRRAERAVVALAGTPGESVPHDLIIFLNRLSDLLFVMARVENQRSGIPDVKWIAP